MSCVGDTTTPSFNTPRSAERSASSAIIWVFPKLFTTPLRTARLVAGRGDDCNPHLPGTLISRHHADIRNEGVLSIVRDRASTNGVHLNGLRVHEAPLTVGDVVGCLRMPRLPLLKTCRLTTALLGDEKSFRL